MGEICKKLGGEGHKKDAGFPMNKENNELILGIIKDNRIRQKCLILLFTCY